MPGSFDLGDPPYVPCRHCGLVVLSAARARTANRCPGCRRPLGAHQPSRLTPLGPRGAPFGDGDGRPVA